jgi:IS1 family transposase
MGFPDKHSPHGLKKAKTLPALRETLLEPEKPEAVELELDEMWSFVYKKKHKRWVWLALCKATRQIVACVVGGRSEATCKRLWNNIPENYKQAVCYSDFWSAYQAVIPDEQHQAVTKQSGLTNHIERFNNTIRQRLARFVRKTLSFSKSEQMHLICLHLFLHRYNLERKTILAR